jgi:hypothetical protein
VKTGVQGSHNTQKTLDSGFRRNDETPKVSPLLLKLALMGCGGEGSRGRNRGKRGEVRIEGRGKTVFGSGDRFAVKMGDKGL